MVGTDCVCSTGLLMDENEGFACTVTGFEEFEEEILRVRSANRDRPETLELALPELAGISRSQTSLSNSPVATVRCAVKEARTALGPSPPPWPSPTPR
jgi:hypothetical protein